MASGERVVGRKQVDRFGAVLIPFAEELDIAER